MSDSFVNRASDGSVQLQSHASYPRAPMDDSKFPWNAEVGERIPQLPLIPVTLSPPRAAGLISPSPSITSSISFFPSHLLRPHPRSPYDAAAWDPSTQSPHPHAHLSDHSSFAPKHQAPLLDQLQTTSSYPQSPALNNSAQSYAPSTLSATHPESTPRSAPFFALPR